MTELRNTTRQEIAILAAAMVGGNLSYIEGARHISAIRFEAKLGKLAKASAKAAGKK